MYVVGASVFLRTFIHTSREIFAIFGLPFSALSRARTSAASAMMDYGGE